MLEIKNVLEMDCQKITMDQLEEIEECPEVLSTECLGYSGKYAEYHWYSVNTTEGDIDVYVK